MTVTESIRRAIERAKVSRYAIAKVTGVSPATLSRFVNRTRGLDGTSIDILATYFGLELRPVKRPRKVR